MARTTTGAVPATDPAAHYAATNRESGARAQEKNRGQGYPGSVHTPGRAPGELWRHCRAGESQRLVVKDVSFTASRPGKPYRDYGSRSHGHADASTDAHA